MPLRAVPATLWKVRLPRNPSCRKEKGVKLTKIQAFNEMAAYHHWRINAPLVKAFVDLSGDTIQWVYDHGVHWKEVKTAWRDKADLTWHIYPSAGSLPKAMVETFKAKGGTLLLSTPAEKLIYKDGKVEAWWLKMPRATPSPLTPRT